MDGISLEKYHTFCNAIKKRNKNSSRERLAHNSASIKHVYRPALSHSLRAIDLEEYLMQILRHPTHSGRSNKEETA